jgi:hypothetical protein
MADDDLDSFFSELKEVEKQVTETYAPPTETLVIAKPQVIAKAPERIVQYSAPVDYSSTMSNGMYEASVASEEPVVQKSTAYAAVPIRQQNKKFVRAGAGDVWVDDSLNEWPENDFRLFVGDLGNEVTTEMVAREFQGKYKSFVKAKVVPYIIIICVCNFYLKVVRTGWNMKSKGYGFVSFMDPLEAAKALREMNGAHIGNRLMSFLLLILTFLKI